MPVLPNRRYPQWAPPGTALLGPLPEDTAARRDAVVARLNELGRVALAVIDIDAVRDCLLPRARIEGPADDHGYDIDLCNRVKGGLLRVERLSDLGIATAIWRLRPDKAGTADLVLAGSAYPPQFIAWDEYAMPTPEAMQAAFEGRPGTLYGDKNELISVFVPLRDSLDDVVAVLELCAIIGDLDTYI
jgi:hypothetical protein